MDASSYASFYAFVSLLIFLAALVYLKVPAKVADLLDDRGARISKELAEAKRLREEAQALLVDFQAKGREAEREAEAIIAEAKAEADRLTTETTKSLEEMITRRTRAAESKIAQAEAQAIAEVRARAADVAIAASETILAAHIKGANAEALIEKSIAEISAKLN
jgi:F-type H+-transporting ATPase subunit b